ncbi:hypothetical protein O6H91_08G060500 [Diphasiastrum complanatum]|uniref:Uncharacterized protein n=1 Tax=Diphasiastrum complanatum TaxID=34168 RepID=A0ACC2CY10_DIPCM|nr:hypothetical protein O6H91_08G060500 [Diphasiastrum complanatum]
MAGLFDKQSDLYAAARPNYPDSLFALLASLSRHHHLAWDVGTGNGQAAVEVAKYYQKVVATDVSEEQLALAPRQPNIEYAVTSKTIEREELDRLLGPEAIVDLITVAQALHWFDLDIFYSHVRRVLRKPGGIVAAWCYQLPSVSPAIDSLIEEYYAASGPYWAHGRRWVEQEYRTIRFPFAPVLHDSTGPFIHETKLQKRFDEFLMYFKSWSAFQTALDKGINLLNEEVMKAFADAWGNVEELRTVTWPVYVLIGAVPSDVALTEATASG